MIVIYFLLSYDRKYTTKLRVQTEGQSQVTRTATQWTSMVSLFLLWEGNREKTHADTGGTCKPHPGDPELDLMTLKISGQNSEINVRHLLD